MIGQIVTDKDGNPIDTNGKKLSVSSYQPSEIVKKAMVLCQKDYQVNWSLQHKSDDAFDGLSLLDRTRVDQETFSAFVGAKFVPQHKKWRWKGRKNTSRNKLIGILAHIITEMLYPNVHSANEQEEVDKKSATVMRIMVEDSLRKANYTTQFLFMVLSALVNPLTIVKIEYLEALQRIKDKTRDGKIRVIEAVDELLSGLNLNIRPIDQVLFSDFYTPLQSQPNIVEVERIPYSKAKKIYAGKFFEKGTGKDLFDYVEAGKTKIVMAGQEGNLLFDVEWSEADQNFVQVVRNFYRDEDLELEWVAGVFMGNEENIYNNNPFKHRRLSYIQDEWVSVPIYPFATSYFEPIDPTGRFIYGKSGAFKLYWDDASQNKMHQLLHDGTFLDVIKPTIISGIAKVDSTVMAPGATFGVPAGANIQQYSLSPNLVAAMELKREEEKDMSESTQDKSQSGIAQPGITATQSIQLQTQARIIMGPFAVLLANLVKQVGELTTDCIVQHTLMGDVDATVPGSLRMKQKILLAKSQEGGKEMTNRIVMTDAFMGKGMTEKQQDDYEWNLWDKATHKGKIKDQKIYHVNPYRFARRKYSWYIDPERIIDSSYGSGKLKKMNWFNMMIHPNIVPYTDPKAVADEVIEEFSVGDPDKFKSKISVNDLMGSIMNQQQMGAQGVQPVGSGAGNNQLSNAMV